MKTKLMNVYYCGHCPKKLFRKHAMERHELMCTKNPDNFRACFGCHHLEKKTITVYNDTPMGGEDSSAVTALHCKKKEIFVHTPQVEIKDNALELGDEFNEPMPKECELAEYGYLANQLPLEASL